MRQHMRASPIVENQCSSVPVGQERKIRTGVVGVGYYGSFHAEKYATLPGCELTAIADPKASHAQKVATEHDVHAFDNHRALIGLVDAVSVVTPAEAHFAVAKDFLQAGIHVLVEKPITQTVAEARELTRLAALKGVVFQVGHLERFNPAFTALPTHLRAPSYIETHRLTRFQKRGDDVSVVLDLMIHDIDLVHALIRSPVATIQARGLSVYSDALDLVNAVIRFENGAVANLTASRASTEPKRTIHLFQGQTHTCLDMQRKFIATQEQGPDGYLENTHVQLDNQDILRTEVGSFLDAIRESTSPVVTGDDGWRALDTAMRIAEAAECNHGSQEALPVHTAERDGPDVTAHVTHDHHPETREPFFARTSLVALHSPIFRPETA